MKTLDKAILLDQCIKGKPLFFNELLGSSFDHFDVFYNICKNNIAADCISEVSYIGTSETGTATFGIVYSSKYKLKKNKKEITLPVMEQDSEVMEKNIAIEPSNDGVIFNILIKE